MNIRKFMIALIITLIVVAGTAVQIQTMKTDIRLLELQSGMLMDEVVELRIKQEQIESRLRYTVMVKELETVLRRVEEVEQSTEGMIFKYKSHDELVKQFFGEVWEK